MARSLTPDPMVDYRGKEKRSHASRAGPGRAGKTLLRQPINASQFLTSNPETWQARPRLTLQRQSVDFWEHISNCTSIPSDGFPPNTERGPPAAQRVDAPGRPAPNGPPFRQLPDICDRCRARAHRRQPARLQPPPRQGDVVSRPMNIVQVGGISNESSGPTPRSPSACRTAARTSLTSRPPPSPAPRRSCRLAPSGTNNGRWSH
jgi:hypothetical protein